MTPLDASDSARPAYWVAETSASAGSADAVEAPMDWMSAWTEALDRLEIDVAEAERMLVRGGPTSMETQAERWLPPTDLGPLPEDLFDRAVRVNARQLETARRLTLALGATRRESDLAGRLARTGADQTPLYVDHLM